MRSHYKLDNPLSFDSREHGKWSHLLGVIKPTIFQWIMSGYSGDYIHTMDTRSEYNENVKLCRICAIIYVVGSV